jgi:hypothetical protein
VYIDEDLEPVFYIVAEEFQTRESLINLGRKKFSLEESVL